MKVTNDRFTKITALVALAAFIALLVFADDARAEDTQWRCTEIQGGNVLVVGDSHTWLSGCSQFYPNNWDVDADPGRASSRALEVTRELLRPRHEIVVFDIATNNRSNPAQLDADIRTLWQELDGRNLVLVNCQTARETISQPPSCAEPNAVLRAFATGHPRRVELARWRSVVDAHPEYIGPDGVHFTTEGYRVRRETVMSAVASTTSRGRR